ncbi:tyrosine-type recombinase/integrase [Nocardioides lianchengensis]|uniref:Site-specific recombinase XerD n=1 Tax=Nocardioides lianchengensis TaxID=1045774 RepID=A0A1G6YHF6_9ACTN|nr:site-specific integrase [Nocardioides lianchengensis]NYG09646.1 integrase [Nocardioides lianchengensis]SDD89711.1 Site-specific recombinase XerD [Nocardioides lianchengensis]
MPEKRSFGQMTKLPSGRIRARYLGPDGVRHSAPYTFETKADAEAWLVDERRLLATGAWQPPKVRAKAASTKLTFEVYAESWLRDRPLKPLSRQHYGQLLNRYLYPTFGHLGLKEITPDSVRAWYALTGTNTPTIRAHAYGLMRTILGTAERDELIPRNPCYIRGAGNATRVRKVKPLTLAELETLVAEMPEQRQLMTLLAAWCAMRFGELAELRRKDIALSDQIVRVRRAVVRVGGEHIVQTPKSAAGIRDIAIPPHLMPLVREHLKKHVGTGKDALLFPGGEDGGHLNPSTLYGKGPGKRSKGYGFYGARAAAGREDLRWHDLRHTGAVLAAQTGATLAELMGRLGHSTPGAALRYQHAAQGRDMEIAKRLSALIQPATS